MMTVPDPVPAGRTVPAVGGVATPRGSRPASVADLLDAHGAEVYRHLRRLVPTADDAADLHQETFLRAHRAWPDLPPDANHRAWLHRIAANVATDAHRRRRVRSGLETGAEDAPGRGDGPQRSGPSGPSGTSGPSGPSAQSGPAEPAADARWDPAVAAEGSELRAAVRAALVTLSPRERTAVIARVLEGREPAEVAAILDCTDVNARQITSRGLRRLRSLLTPYLETDR